ncbi:MAG TPA: thiamine phosphate synthase [Pyrinomonadaceae bacterium]|nr:thiamine phosphate synthase [Pyrinomonadaceae bacterium]
MTLDLSRPLVYLITPGACEPDSFTTSAGKLVETIAAAADAGVDLVQVREKRLGARMLFVLAERLVEVVRGSSTKLLINDRFDIALAAGASGVHLTSTSMRPAVVRTCVPEDFVIGVSVHRGDDMAASTEGAELAVFGPVFPTPGKGGGVGTEILSEACKKAVTPIVAIGGINETNYREVLNAGAAGFAAIRALNDPASMRRILKELSR